MNDLKLAVENGKCIFRSASQDVEWEDRELGFAIYQVVDVLYRRSSDSKKGLTWAQGTALLKHYVPNPYYYFVFHMLDNFGLEEHGGSTPGWLPYDDDAEELYRDLIGLFGPLCHADALQRVTA